MSTSDEDVKIERSHRQGLCLTVGQPTDSLLFALSVEDRVKAEKLAEVMTREGVPIGTDEAVLMQNMSHFVAKAMEYDRSLTSKLARDIFGGKSAKSLAMLAVMAEFIAAAHRGYEDVNLLALRFTDTMVAVLANADAPRPKFKRKVKT